MSVLAILPARYGSPRFPGKPLAPIGGKPMIQHVWERTRAAKSVDTVVVATDDERIRDACAASCAETRVHVFTGGALIHAVSRPQVLAAGHVTRTPPLLF